jgi:hypothetical protein
LPGVHNQTHEDVSTKEKLVVETVGGITIHPAPGVVIVTSSIVVKDTCGRKVVFLLQREIEF